jgi:type II secretory pathway pseudopilin PulG
VTLLEAALVLSLTGVLLAAFLPTFLAHVQTSKIAEATGVLAALHQHAAAYYEAERTVGSRKLRGCLPEPAGPFPELPNSQPVEVDFSADAKGAATWLALGLGGPKPLRYSYEVAVPSPGCGVALPNEPAITFRAHGNLDGDDAHSLLERSAAASADGLTLVPHGPLRMIARTE